MNEDKITREKTRRPHTVFHDPCEVVADPALSKDQKSAALDALEQDARQLSVASDEGMAGGEPTKLHEVLDAKAALELPPTDYAYDVVLKDLRARLTLNATGDATRDATGDARALVEQAIAALEATRKSPTVQSAGAVG